MSSSETEPSTSRLGTILLGIATVIAVLAAAEAALRMGAKDVGGPATYGLVYRPALPANLQEDDHAPFVTNLDGLYTARPGDPGINADGFRGPDLVSLEGKRDLVLLLGDGPVYGDGASTPETSFAARIAAGGMPVANLGIPGTGVRQYAALAEKYIPRLRPKAVYLFFNTGDDFELDPPVQPGYKRYHFAGGAPLPAAAYDAQPLTISQAVAQANEAATPPGTLTRLARTTVIGNWIADLAGAGGIAPQLPEVLETLQRVRNAADEAGAWFHIVLTPLPAGVRGDAVARAAQALDEFSPLVMPPLDAADFADAATGRLADGGHAKVAKFILEQIAADATGVAPVPRALQNLGPLTVDEFATGLNLTREQATEFINGMKKILADVMFEPAVDAPSPGQYALGFLTANPAGAPGFGAELSRYLAQHVHAASGLYYTDLITERISKATASFADALPESLKPNFIQYQQRDIGSVDTGYDAISERMSQELNKAKEGKKVEEMPWDEFTAALKLDDAQKEQGRAIVDSLKQDYADTFAKPAKDAPSPLDQLAAQVKGGATPELLAATMNQCSALPEAGSGRTYTDLLNEKNSQRLAEFTKLLRAEQLAQFATLPIDSLYKVSTGTDPFRAQLALRAFGHDDTSQLPSLAPTDMRRWENFRNSLKLTDAQADQIKKFINALKDDVATILNSKPVAGEPSPVEVLEANRAKGIPEAAKLMIEQAVKLKDPATGKTLQELLGEVEMRARRAIFTVLTPDQLPLYDKVPSFSFGEIDTGYESPNAPKLK